MDGGHWTISRATGTYVAIQQKKRSVRLVFDQEGLVVGGFGDTGDHAVARGIAGGGVRDEDGDGQATTAGKSNEANIVCGGCHFAHKIG